MLLKKINKAKISERQSIAQMTDEELLLAINEASYIDIIDEVFNRYSHILYGLCFKYLRNTEESRDAVQSIFEKIFTDMGSHTVKNLKAWLFVVAKNYCLMQLRKRQLETKELTPENTSPILFALYEEEMSVSESDSITEKNVSKMLSLMNELSSPQSICLNMMYLDDKSYKEIADITGFGLNEVKSHIQNGKRNLRNLLTRSND